MVSRTWIDVGIIRKPAYRVSVVTDRHVVIAGQTVQVTVEADFFDGQPVPATPFAVRDDYDDTTTTTATTGADGRATSDWSPSLGDQPEGSDWRTVSVTPARPEEGEITSDAAVLVFPSALNLMAEGSVSGSRLVVTGSVHDVDLARLERELSASDERYGDIDPNGRPVAGATVTAAITELIPVRRLTGYDYDSITKRVIPRYEYDFRRKALRTVTVTTRADGTFRLSVRVPTADHEYEVALTTVDSAGRTERRSTTATRPVKEQSSDLPVFESIVGPRERDLVYRIGEPVRLTMTDGVKPLPTGGSNRYLYVVSKQGLRSATVTTSPRFSRRFAASDTPGIFIIGVRFTGRTYASKADAWAMFDTRQRRVTVALTSRPDELPAG